MIDLYASMGITFFEAICVSIFWDSFLTLKKDTHKMLQFVLIVLSTFAVVFTVPFFFRDTASLIQTILKFTILTICLSVICRLAFKVNYTMAVILSAVLFFLVYFIDYVGLALTDIVMGRGDAYMQLNIPARLFCAMIYKASLFLAIMIIRAISVRVYGKRARGNQEIQVNNKFRWSLYSLMPTLCIVSITGIFSLTSKEEHGNPLLLLLAISWLFMCFVVFFFLQIADEQEAKYRTSQMIEQSVQTELEWLRAIAIVNENYHEYQNDLIAIKNYLLENHSDMALDYINKLPYSGMLSAPTVRTGNEVVDAILNQKYCLAKSRDIHILPVLSNLADLKMDDRDLVAIISNLLDNAIEACELVEQDKVIQLKIVKEDSNLIIAVKNPTAEPVSVVNGNIASHKRDKHLHGFGLRAIKRALDKYGSSYAIKTEGLHFIFSAVIPLEPDTPALP